MQFEFVWMTEIHLKESVLNFYLIWWVHEFYFLICLCHNKKIIVESSILHGFLYGFFFINSKRHSHLSDSKLMNVGCVSNQIFFENQIHWDWFLIQKNPERDLSFAFHLVILILAEGQFSSSIGFIFQKSRLNNRLPLNSNQTNSLWFRSSPTERCWWVNPKFFGVRIAWINFFLSLPNGLIKFWFATQWLK